MILLHTGKYLPRQETGKVKKKQLDKVYLPIMKFNSLTSVIVI